MKTEFMHSLPLDEVQVVPLRRYLSTYFSEAEWRISPPGEDHKLFPALYGSKRIVEISHGFVRGFSAGIEEAQ